MKPYKIPCVNKDTVNKMEMQLEDSLATHAVMQLTWNLQMYRSLSKKGENKFEGLPAQLPIIEQAHIDNAHLNTLVT